MVVAARFALSFGAANRVHAAPIARQKGWLSRYRSRRHRAFRSTAEAVGKNVPRLRPGDDVFGSETGAFGEYVTVHQDWAVVLKPPGVTSISART